MYNLKVSIAQISFVSINDEGHEAATLKMHSVASGSGTSTTCCNKQIDDVEALDEEK